LVLLLKHGIVIPCIGPTFTMHINKLTNFLKDNSILSYSPPSHSCGTVTSHHMNVGGENSATVSAQKFIPISQCKNEKQNNER
jgi:hypothetical protein